MGQFYTSLKHLNCGGRACAIKMEKEFPPGSHKGRLGIVIAEHLIAKKCNEVLVSSSGNFADSVAFYTQGSGIRVRVVTDVLSSPSLINALRKYPHVEIILIDSPDETGSHLKARLQYIEQVRKAEPGVYFIDQYDNELLALVYEDTLAREIWQQTSGAISSIFMPCGTGATIRGLASYFKKVKPSVKIFAVDALGSNLFRAGMGKRKLPGYGNSKATGLIKASYGFIDHVVFVSDEAAISMCHAYKKEYSMWLGPSSGAAVAALQQIAAYKPHLLSDSGIPVVIAPDGGEKYVETVYSDEWCRTNFSARIMNHNHLHIMNYHI